MFNDGVGGLEGEVVCAGLDATNVAADRPERDSAGDSLAKNPPELLLWGVALSIRPDLLGCRLVGAHRTGEGATADHKAALCDGGLTVIAEVCRIGVESGSGRGRGRHTAVDSVALVKVSYRGTNVRQLGDHGVSERAQAGHQADHQNRANQYQFGGDDNTAFIIPKLFHHGFKLSVRTPQQTYSTCVWSI